MHAILMYDISIDRINAVRVTTKQYLNWIQNSVFEGEITMSGLAELKSKISELIDVSEDSVLIFTVNNPRWIEKTVIGIDKNDICNII